LLKIVNNCYMAYLVTIVDFLFGHLVFYDFLMSLLVVLYILSI